MEVQVSYEVLNHLTNNCLLARAQMIHLPQKFNFYPNPASVFGFLFLWHMTIINNRRCWQFIFYLLTDRWLMRRHWTNWQHMRKKMTREALGSPLMGPAVQFVKHILYKSRLWGNTVWRRGARLSYSGTSFACVHAASRVKSGSNRGGLDTSV